MILNALQAELSNLREKNLFRYLCQVDSDQDSEIWIEGKKCVNFSSNNYLGLANDSRLKSASILATEKYGTGSGASRLITGSMKLHHELEKKIAEFKGTEAALLFNSGYHANIGVLSALLREGDFIFSDELNHASIIDGCRLSRATVQIYRHRDANHLEELLNREVRQVRHVRRIIVTDTVFSMDGDIAPLKDLVKLAEKQNCWLMADEAHATGVYGLNGRGLVEELLGSANESLIQMGTLGKALGSFGAYVAGSKTLIEYLINKSRSFIYTTALPPGVVASALTAIEIIEKGPERRKKLWENVKYFERRRQNKENKIISPIIPIVIGDSQKALELSQKLFEKGLLVTAIRYPTVPKGTERLRITLMATHTKEQIDRLIEALHELL